ncbi:MAG: polysaccharide biosynthesis/export family protein [Fermentimonas sp.]|nr:polysaccharide biosynthesis/export family protein [Fermentimonas sp.]
MKINVYLLFLAIVAVSCTPARDVAYFQQVGEPVSTLSQAEYSARIKPKDLLSVTVVSSEPDASRRYNLITPQPGTQIGYLQSQPTLQNYLVDEEGNINFPSLGLLQVKGLTTKELEKLIEDRLRPYFTEEMPIITARIMNYSVNMIGEVHRPGQFQTENGRMTVLEGLALAGDMTIYGRRDNVKVIREDADGERVVYTLNFNDKNVFNSPGFFLEQNDVVYVEPNVSRANSSKYGAAESYRITTVSVLISLATMAITIFGLTR